MSHGVLQASRGLGRRVAGPVLAAADDFSARYDLDRTEGVFSRPAHRLFGQSYVGKVLVLNAAKGGVATSWMLRDMAERGLAPLALILNDANPIMAQGAAFAGVPLMDRFDHDVTELLRTDDLVEVDPAARMVRVLERASVVVPGEIAAGSPLPVRARGALDE